LSPLSSVSWYCLAPRAIWFLYFSWKGKLSFVVTTNTKYYIISFAFLPYKISAT
jgi:hypothetical protein